MEPRKEETSPVTKRVINVQLERVNIVLVVLEVKSFMLKNTITETDQEMVNSPLLDQPSDMVMVFLKFINQTQDVQTQWWVIHKVENTKSASVNQDNSSHQSNWVKKELNKLFQRSKIDMFTMED